MEDAIKMCLYVYAIIYILFIFFHWPSYNASIEVET